MKKYVIVVDVSKCTGCYACQVACKDEHVGNDWGEYAKPQPLTGHFWMKVFEFERGSVPKVKVTYIPRPCMHCDEPPCVNACPSNAIIKRDDGIVLISPSKCTGWNGCRECIKACPYGVIYFNNALMIAQKCTLCTHLLDDPNWKYGPRCVEVCPVGALIFGTEDDPKIKELIMRSETLNPEFQIKRPFGIPREENKYKPRVYYTALPKPFVAGALVDMETDECLEGAIITARDIESGKEYKTTSDVFGDFWLTLEWNHEYIIQVQRDGYEEVTLNACTEKDVNLGDIYIKRKK